MHRQSRNGSNHSSFERREAGPITILVTGVRARAAGSVCITVTETGRALAHKRTSVPVEVPAEVPQGKVEMRGDKIAIVPMQGKSLVLIPGSSYKVYAVFNAPQRTAGNGYRAVIIEGAVPLSEYQRQAEAVKGLVTIPFPEGAKDPEDEITVEVVRNPVPYERRPGDIPFSLAITALIGPDRMKDKRFQTPEGLRGRKCPKPTLVTAGPPQKRATGAAWPYKD